MDRKKPKKPKSIQKVGKNSNYPIGALSKWRGAPGFNTHHSKNGRII